MPDPGQKQDQLARDLEALMSKSRSAARLNYWAALVCTWGALLISIFTAWAGIFEFFQPKVIAFLALMPGILGLFPATLKFQQRANWHYRKKDSARSLLNELNYCASDPPTREEIASIAGKLSRLNLDMGKDWEDSLAVEMPDPAKTSKLPAQ